MKTVIALCVPLFIGAGLTHAAAPLLNDPTRPPGPNAAQTGSEMAGGPVLQSVIISPAVTGAIIDGQFVRLGEKFGQADLVRVTEQEVVLREGGASRSLKMYPGVVRGDVTGGNVGRPGGR